VAPHQDVPGISPGRNASALAAVLAVESGSNKIIYQDILTALAEATNDPCLCPAISTVDRVLKNNYDSSLDRRKGSLELIVTPYMILNW